MYTAGENTNSQLGRGTGTELEVTSLDQIVMPSDFTGTIVDVSAGQLHGAFLTSAGEVYTWGDGNLGKLGNGSTANVDRLVPTKVAALDGIEIASIQMANGASYAISADGILYAWGQNTNGQLGIGSLINQGTPVAVASTSFGGEKVAAVSSGTSFTLVLTETGNVYAMGGNVQMQAGPNGSGRMVSTPVLVDIPGDVVSIEAGTNTAFVITATGEVYGWGQSDFGQLVKGTIEPDGSLSNYAAASSATPTLIAGLPDDITEIHVGSRWVIATTADGEVWTWGDQGWLDSTQEDTVKAPFQIVGLEGIRIVDIVSGPNHALLVDADGNVYGLGATADGRMGFLQADADRVSEPVLIPVPANDAQMLIDGSDDQTAGTVITTGILDAGKTHFSVYGFGGDDTITSGASGDLLKGGAGNDILFGFGGDDHLDGGIGADILTGGAGSDTIDGGDGDDQIFAAEDGTAESDTVNAGAGDDDVTGGSTDILDGGAGNDVLNLAFGDGDPGQSPLILSLSADGTGFASDGTSITGFEMLNLSLTEGDDATSTGDVQVSIDGGGGDDRIVAGAAADVLNGGDGNDVLEGGGGADTLNGDAGVNTASYESSAAGVSIDLANNVNSGGDAEGDVLVNITKIIGSSHDDVISGDGAANTLTGGGGQDSLFGQGGNDRLVISETPAFISGGTGKDFLFATGGGHVVLTEDGFSAVEAVYVRGGGTHLDMSGVETGAKIVAQSAAGFGVTVIGTAGNDTIRGGKGSDSLEGGAGNDRIVAGTGASALDGGTGNDKLFGGAGTDIFHFGADYGRDNIYDFDATSDFFVVSELVESFDDIAIKSIHSGRDTQITFVGDDDATHKIILHDVVSSTLSDSSFLFG